MLISCAYTATLFLHAQAVGFLMLLLNYSSSTIISAALFKIRNSNPNTHPKMSHLMRKPIICICENKDADQLRGSAFVFATRIVQFLLYLTPKFQASSLLLCLYSSVCVRPGQKPHCWVFHEVAQMVDHPTPSMHLQLTGELLLV